MKVFFIGAGPGNPELITIKAQKILKKAALVIYAGSLVNDAVLKWCRKDARIYNSASMDLDTVCAIYKRHTKKAGIIARLHTGDPSIYSAIQEQMAFCGAHEIEYEIIPGVSSFCAASAALGQELTLPGISQTIIISRLSGRTKVPHREKLKKLASIRATLILFLSVGRIADVVTKLSHGYSKNTPVAVVSRASWPDEIIITGPLTAIAKKVKESGIKKQALIIVGNVLKKRGYQKSKLYDKTFTHMYRKGI